MSTRQIKILENANDPHALEVLFRTNPKEFEENFEEAFKEKPESELLKFWDERINFRSETTTPNLEPTTDRPSLLFVVILLSLIGGTLAKLPLIVPSIDNERFYYERNISFFILPLIAIYFLYKHRTQLKDAFIPLGIFLCAAIAINLFPSKELPHSKFRLHRSIFFLIF
ncbi:MAG: hypothetical protein ABH886_09045 [Candidatus Desantisbacteria bacterium]